MLRRLEVVLLTYATRRLTWMAGLLWLVVNTPWIVLELVFVHRTLRNNQLLADTCSLIAFDGFGLFLLLRSQIRLHFSQPAARLVPNYAIPHLIPIVSIWLFAMLLHTASLQLAGVPFPAAFGFSLLPWGICCGCSLLAKPTGGSGAAHRILQVGTGIGVVVVLHFVHKLFVAFGEHSSVEQYLQGDKPVWTIAIIVSSLVLIAAYVRRSLYLATQYSEASLNGSLLCSVGEAPAAWRQEAIKQQPAWTTPIGDRRLMIAVNRATQPGWLHRCNLWRAGNSKTVSVAVLALVTVAMTLTAWGTDKRPLQDATGERLFVTFLRSAMLVSIIVFALLSARKWRERRICLEIELLRPVTRNEFANQIVAAIAWDLLPVAIILASALISILFTVPQPVFELWAVLPIFFVALWVMNFAMVLWSIVIRQEWVLFVLLFVFLFAPMIAINMLTPRHLTIAEFRDACLLDAGKFADSIYVYCLLAAVLAALAYQRWKTMEIASCSSSSDR